ncbi:hypothetical protein ACWJKU_07950 [Methylocaldum sp. MU1018]
MRAAGYHRPEGDFVTPSDRFGHVVVDGERTEAELVGIATRIRQHRVSGVLSLEGLEADEQVRAAGIFLNALFDRFTGVQGCSE